MPPASWRKAKASGKRTKIDGREKATTAGGDPHRQFLHPPRPRSTVLPRVKHRQAFRPFAPVVLEERAEEIFEAHRESPFMLLAEQVRPEWRDKIPAVVHIDGTGRVQTIRQDQNERLYRLLQEFDALTGVPVLLNTSFNVKGEPIVETPEDAIPAS
jgi:carbamoyltransferase